MTAQMLADQTTTLAVPEELSSTTSKLVYLYLQATDGRTVDELSESLHLKRIELYPVLDSLSERDLVEREDGTFRAVAS